MCFLLPSSINWYRSKGDSTLQLGRQTHGYLPSRMASSPLDVHRLILLGNNNSSMNVRISDRSE